MDTIELSVGSLCVIDGCQQDDLRPVQFRGELVGSRRELTDDRGTRGRDESLYRTDDGRLVVYIENWSRWQGEPSYYKLIAVDETDLGVNGRFEMLGRACGMARPLTLDEALEAESDGQLAAE